MLPSRTDYPDYYKLIKKPVSIEKILLGANKRSFKSIEDVKTKFDTMFSNAKFYNEENSWVYNDATALNEFTDKWFSSYVTGDKKQ